MMLFARRSAGPLLAAALLALDAGAARAQGQIVRLPEQDRRLAGTAAEVFSIGKAEGAEHEMFGEIGSVAFDASDNLYVLDRQAKRVMVYDRTGRFLRQVGKPGQGPGELVVPWQLMIGGDGTLVVADLGRPAYSLFRPDGSFLRNVDLSGLPDRGAPLVWHPRGGVVGAFRQPLAERAQAGSSTITETVLPLTFQAVAGGAPTRVFSIPRTMAMHATSSAPGQLQVRATPPPEFTPPVLYDALPSGHVALGFTSGYTVRIVDLNGQTLRYLQRPLRVRLTAPADRERAREAVRERMESGRGMLQITRGGPGGGGGSGPAPGRRGPSVEQRLAEMEFADTIPALQGLRVSPSGKLLVERTGANVGDPGPVDVITAEGQYLGTFTGIGLPDAMSRSGLAAYIQYDEDQVGRVIVRRLPAGWR